MRFKKTARPKQYPLEIQVDVLQLRRAGRSYRQIARDMNLGLTTVYRWLNWNGAQGPLLTEHLIRKAWE